MKKIISKALMVLFLLVVDQLLFAQPLPPSDHGSTGNETSKNGGGAPIAGGIDILLLLGAAYGSKKVWDMRKKPVA